ncbi:MAG: lipoyl(octanoyl) transferase LipB [Candidatus Omnitrophica bacterium]|nr:lipoyl(octanoyl) transferase LipB [Candidatus Omnitrophota bacterium]
MLDCSFVDLGLKTYREAYQIQLDAVKDVVERKISTILFCEHPLTITIGRSGKAEHIRTPRSVLSKNGVMVCDIDRGGDVTLHAPGQLIVYPILDLRQWRQDLHVYLRALEGVVIELLDQYGLVASRKAGYTGVWIRNRKICSIGIGVRCWVTYHGLSLNVHIPLRYYSLIKPCGLDVSMTSIADQTKEVMDLGLIKQDIIRLFKNTFNLRILGKWEPQPVKV